MKSVVEHLSDLIRIPSMSRLSNRPVIDYVRSMLKPTGWRFREYIYIDTNDVEKVNLIAAPPGTDVEETDVDLALLCHTDTVPYAASWDQATEPFVKDGLLYGCGACDVKGFLACALAAALAPATQPVHRGLRLVLTADEEVGCIGTSHMMETGCIRPSKVLIGEPTSLHPARAGKGYCLAEIAVFGKEAHSAHPAQGASAIYAATELIAEIRRIAKNLESSRNVFFEPEYTTINVGTIQGGTAKNIVAGQCTFQLEWRPLPAQPYDVVIEQVRQAAVQLEQAWRGMVRYDIHVIRTQPGFETRADAELVQTLEAMSTKPAIAIPFGSEAPYFAAVTNDVVVFGPGDMRTAHSERECVPIAELHAALTIMKQLIRSR